MKSPTHICQDYMMFFREKIILFLSPISSSLSQVKRQRLEGHIWHGRTLPRMALAVFFLVSFVMKLLYAALSFILWKKQSPSGMLGHYIGMCLRGKGHITWGQAWSCVIHSCLTCGNHSAKSCVVCECWVVFHTIRIGCYSQAGLEWGPNNSTCSNSGKVI